MAIVLDPWKVPAAISFPVDNIVVVLTIEGVQEVVYSNGGHVIAGSQAVKIGKTLLYSSTYNTVASLFVFSVGSDFSNLSAMFTTTNNGHGGPKEFVDFQTLLNQLTTKYPSATVVRGPVLGEKDNLPPHETNGPFYQNIWLKDWNEPTYIDVFRSSGAIGLEANRDGSNSSNDLILSFHIAKLFPTEHVFTVNVTIDAYQINTESKFEGQSDGTMKVSNAKAKWSASLSHPGAADAPPSTVNYLVGLKGVTKI